MDDIKVPIRTALKDLWADLSAAQKWVAIALVALVVVALAGSWVNTFQTWNTVRQYENQAIEAERDKQEALEQVTKIAEVVKIREEELAKVVGKRDEKSNQVKSARDDVATARAEYERAVRTRRPDAPSSDELCRELAALGHPCQPR